MKIQLFLAATLLVGCGGKKDDGGGAGTSSGKAVETKAEPAGPFAEFGSTDDVLAKWQGAWVLETGALGHYEAWEVKGTKVTSWVGKAEKVRELQIDSPCEGQVIARSNGGSSADVLRRAWHRWPGEGGVNALMAQALQTALDGA